MSTALTAQLPRKRARWLASLDQIGTVTHTPRVSDGAGGYTDGTPTTATYACRVQPELTTPQERLAGGTVQALVYWDVHLPYTAVVSAQDTITVAGTVYQVQGVTTGRSLNYGLTARCVAVEGAP